MSPSTTSLVFTIVVAVLTLGCGNWAYGAGVGFWPVAQAVAFTGVLIAAVFVTLAIMDAGDDDGFGPQHMIALGVLIGVPWSTWVPVIAAAFAPPYLSSWDPAFHIDPSFWSFAHWTESAWLAYGGYGLGVMLAVCGLWWMRR